MRLFVFYLVCFYFASSSCFFVFIFLLRTLCSFLFLHSFLLRYCQFMCYLSGIVCSMCSFRVKYIEIVYSTFIYWMFWPFSQSFCSVQCITKPKTSTLSLSLRQCAMNWTSVHKINLHTKLPHSIQTKFVHTHTHIPTPLKNGYYYFQSNDVGFDCSSAFFFISTLNALFSASFCLTFALLSFLSISFSFSIRFSRIESSSNAEGWIYKTSKQVRANK